MEKVNCIVHYREYTNSVSGCYNYIITNTTVITKRNNFIDLSSSTHNSFKLRREMIPHIIELLRQNNFYVDYYDDFGSRWFNILFFEEQEDKDIVLQGKRLGIPNKSKIANDVSYSLSEQRWL